MSDFNSNIAIVLHIRKLFIALLLVLLVTFTLTYICYRGDCNYAKEAISDIGALEAKCGESNCVSQYIFSGGMMISAFILAFISRGFMRWDNLAHKRRVVGLCRISSIGFALIMMPTDGIRVLHLVGVFLGVGGLWFLTLQLLSEARSQFEGAVYWALHIVLDIGIIGYFLEISLTWGDSAYMQKVGFLALAAVFFIVLQRMLHRARFEDREGPMTRRPDPIS